jgi:uncharacterized protein (TIGR03067 family)
MSRLLILGLVCFIAGADDAKDEAVKKELERLQGAWTVTKAEIDGMVIEGDALMGQKLTFKGGRVEATGGGTKKSDIKVDPSKKPGHIDLIPDKDAKGPPVIPCIYELKGDTLKIGMPTGKGSEKIDPNTGKTIDKKSEPLGMRPKGFDAKDIMILTLKRDAK